MRTHLTFSLKKYPKERTNLPLKKDLKSKERSFLALKKAALFKNRYSKIRPLFKKIKKNRKYLNTFKIWRKYFYFHLR
jgi:hypothetical protein